MSELKECPFCGGEAEIRHEAKEFKIVGCKGISMLCPNPSITVYDHGEGYDYSPWNNRNSIDASKIQKLINTYEWDYRGDDYVIIQKLKELIGVE